MPHIHEETHSVLKAVFRYVFGTDERTRREEDVFMARRIDEGVQKGTLQKPPPHSLDRADEAVDRLSQRMEAVKDQLNKPALTLDEALSQIVSKH
jgi:hypothetical protein